MTNDEHDDDRFDALVRHVVRTAPVAEPPAGFAHEMTRQVADHAEEAGVETWLMGAALAIAAVAIPLATFSSPPVQELLRNAPWPLLLTTAAVFGGMKLLELARSPITHRTESTR